MSKKDAKPNHQELKQDDLLPHKSDGTNKPLTTNTGVKVNDDNNWLKAGSRGPSLLEDFIMREKITHFDHERIPERIVHARGSAAHGYFECTKAIPELTRAGFLQEVGTRTPVFCRFSTVAGSKGSTDMARDARGFAVKFYTQDGIFDLVGNNIPVFFIQDAAKFPDLVHAVKPEPHHEMPQAASAHDTFWDFISLMPETMHMIMWTMSDRAIPRSYRMMEGFGVHTFRLVNTKGEASFVKFHWKPRLGTHAVVWEEAQIISGKNPDFHREDLWQAIESGQFPEWDLGIQIIPESDEHKFDYDLLDPTKLVPEEEVPVTLIGKMVLNRNPDNFFAETEQAAFHPGHIVPGIDFTNDPLLQGRLFSYTDTQLLRLGGPNFHEIPINRSISPTHNNQRDGFMRQEINQGRVHYSPNSLGGGCPYQAMIADGGFQSYNERIEASKIRERSESFRDHFSQARLFYNSQTEVEQLHIIRAITFELSKVATTEIRVRTVGLLNQINTKLAEEVAKGLGIRVPDSPFTPLNHGVSADRYGQEESEIRDAKTKKSKPLSMVENPTNSGSIASRKVAFFCGDGVSAKSVADFKEALLTKGAKACIIAPHMGFITTDENTQLPVHGTYDTEDSVLYDAVFIPDGAHLDEIKNLDKVIDFINLAYRHCKVIGANGKAGEILKQTRAKSDEGVITHDNVHDVSESFIKALGKHRIWSRDLKQN